MKSISVTFFSLIIALGLSVGQAEAKKFGSGKSFGSKKSFFSPQKRNVQKSPTKSIETPSGSAATGAAAGTAGGAAAGGAARSGLMAGIAGLAMGGMLGALFFGGAFENINLMDILIFALLGFLLYKIFAARKRAQYQEQETATAEGPMAFEEKPNAHEIGAQQRATQQGAATQQIPSQAIPTNQQKEENSQFDTDVMFKNKDEVGNEVLDSTVDPAVESDPVETIAFNQGAPKVPKGFATNDFLQGAKAAYERLHKAWDEGDLGDIRQFTTDKVFGEVQDQFQQRDGDNKTELLEANVQLLEVKENGNELEASVYFKVELRETDLSSGSDGRIVKSEEVWHFTQPIHGKQTTWYLDGIQQVED